MTIFLKHGFFKPSLLIVSALYIPISPALADSPTHYSPSPASTVNTPVISHHLTGLWRTIDDKTGYAKSVVKIEQSNDGSYGGTVVQVLSHAGYTPKVYCQNCPAPFTSKPILGLHLLWGLKANPDDHTLYADGQILDPLSGHIYSAKATISPDGKKLALRGYLGVSLLGRSQIWTRAQ